MKKAFDHIGIITTAPQPGESWVADSEVWVTNPRLHPNRLEYVRPKVMPTVPPEQVGLWKLWHWPHVAYRVEDLREAIVSEEVVLGPFFPAPFVEVHPDDAKRLDLEEGEFAQISSRRGTIQLPVRLNAGMRRGMVFVPFHWGDLYGEGNAANYLTISAIGRVAKQPELKFCAVNLEKVPQARPEEACRLAPAARCER